MSSAEGRRPCSGRPRGLGWWNFDGWNRKEDAETCKMVPCSMVLLYPDAPWCWNIYLHDWVIFGVSMLVNIPAPWFASGIWFSGFLWFYWIWPPENQTYVYTTGDWGDFYHQVMWDWRNGNGDCPRKNLCVFLPCEIGVKPSMVTLAKRILA